MVFGGVDVSVRWECLVTHRDRIADWSAEIIFYGLVASAVLVVFLLAVIRSQISYQQSLRESIIALHKRASSAEMALAAMQQVQTNLTALEQTQHEQNLQAVEPGHLSRRADFESGWLSDGAVDRISTGAKASGTDASDVAQD